MAIRFDAVTEDAQGLPVVSWVEDRNRFAPGGISPARVACFIRPDEKTGVLQFVRVGSVRHGPFEEARPWQFLLSFEKSTAEQQYYTPEERVAMEILANKVKNGAGRILTTDGAQVMLANFGDERSSDPMHLNCATARPVDVALLHDRLNRAFLLRRNEFVDERCGGLFTWPADELFTPYAVPKLAKLPLWADWLANLCVVAVLALLGLAIYELLPH